MEALYHQSQKLGLEIRELLPAIDRNVGHDAVAIEQSVFGKLEEITSNIQRLDILVNKELPVRRREARLKVDQLKQDRLMLQNAIHSLQHRRYQKEQEAAAREELLTQTFQPNNRETALYIDHSLQHHSSLTSVGRSLDEIWENGYAVLDNLRSQKSSLKNAHRRLLDVTNMLSLSNTLMRVIERRTTKDRFLFYGLVGITAVVIVASFWYFGS